MAHRNEGRRAKESLAALVIRCEPAAEEAAKLIVAEVRRIFPGGTFSMSAALEGQTDLPVLDPRGAPYALGDLKDQMESAEEFRDGIAAVVSLLALIRVVERDDISALYDEDYIYLRPAPVSPAEPC